MVMLASAPEVDIIVPLLIITWYIWTGGYPDGACYKNTHLQFQWSSYTHRPTKNCISTFKQTCLLQVPQRELGWRTWERYEVVIIVLVLLTRQNNRCHCSSITGKPTVLRDSPQVKGAGLTTGRPTRTDHTCSVSTDSRVLTAPTVLSSHCE